MTDDRSAGERSDTTPTGTMSDINTDPETETAMTANDSADERSPDRGPDESIVPRLDRLSTERLRGLLDRVALAALVVLALIAGWSFYGHAGAAIRTWIDPSYQPIALAAFNLAVLLVALAGVTHQLARIRESEGAEAGGNTTAGAANE